MKSNIEKNVMAGVAAVYVARKLSSRRALKAYLLLACVLGLAVFTSLPHVFINFEHMLGSGLPAVSTYVVTAVTKTSVLVQLILVVAALAGLSLAKDTVVPKGQRWA
jgi:hypothetical protein